MQWHRITQYSKPSIALVLLLTVLISLFVTTPSLSAVENVSNGNETMSRPPMLMVVSLGDEGGSPGLISFINMVDNSLITTIDPQGAHPNGVVVSPDMKFAYVVDATSHNILVVDLETFTIIRKFVVPGGTGDIETSPDGTLLYIAGDQVKGISIVDAASGTVQRTIPIGEWPAKIALNSRGDQLWYTSGTSKFVFRINLLNDSITRIAMGNVSFDVAISPDEKFVYVVQPWLTYALSVIDVASNAVIKTFPYDGMLWGIAINADGSRVYVTDRTRRMISVIDGVRHEVLTPITGVGNDPGTIIMTPDQRFLYVTDYTKVWKVDLVTNRVIGDAIPVHIGVEAFAIVLPIPDDRDAHIIIVKEAQPKSTQDFAYYGPFGKFLLDDAFPNDKDGVLNSRTYTVKPGTYNFAEGVFQSWYLADIQCVGTGQSINDMLKRSVSITAKAGDQITCTFVTQRRVNLQAIKFNDLNADGIRQANEPTLTPWEFRFYKSDGTLINHKVTDANGSAVQNNVIPGSFKVCETQQSGWTNTLPGQLDLQLGLPCYNFTLQPGQNASLLFGNTQKPIIRSANELDASAGLGISELSDINEPESERSIEEADASLRQLYLPIVSRQ